ncbi:hypothetical protein jhhlp_008389 [Lomentospora prolificans]|uniref:GH18 domain-containing protein n=1 Tax=Lomentospora prolificans TaxID=41688 RepID=A0A2N3MXX0_9PEZI|nr:hypothetical protein jhhlp_008389 [Lomentospora prolificans]
MGVGGNVRAFAYWRRAEVMTGRIVSGLAAFTPTSGFSSSNSSRSQTGGWAFSTEPASYKTLRRGTNPEHAETLASNIANFVNDNGLDGVDIDWEYPAAPDIIPDDPGEKLEANYYLDFLWLLKGKLGNKTVSIAAPASYWYLKQFTIGKIGRVVDYIV